MPDTVGTCTGTPVRTEITPVHLEPAPAPPFAGHPLPPLRQSSPKAVEVYCEPCPNDAPAGAGFARPHQARHPLSLLPQRRMGPQAAVGLLAPAPDPPDFAPEFRVPSLPRRRPSTSQRRARAFTDGSSALPRPPGEVSTVERPWIAVRIRVAGQTACSRASACDGSRLLTIGVIISVG